MYSYVLNLHPYYMVSHATVYSLGCGPYINSQPIFDDYVDCISQFTGFRITAAARLWRLNAGF